jgi:hypothetical protein
MVVVAVAWFARSMSIMNSGRYVEMFAVHLHFCSVADTFISWVESPMMAS